MKEERKIIEINIDDILPNRFQPRITFDEVAIAELSSSIKEHGVIQPIVVRKVGDKYEIIAGERRYKASVMANLDTIPAVITDLNDKDSAEVALIENVQRQDLTPIEEAISYKKILDMGYLTQEELALKLGKSQSTVANKLRLLNLEDDVQEALLNKEISERHARSLLKIEDSSKQVEMLNRIIKERLTVRKTDEEIDKMNNDNVEKVIEIEPTVDLSNNTNIDMPGTFDFSFSDNKPNNEPKQNLFDLSEQLNDDSSFFGFNQNIFEEENKNISTSNNINNIFMSDEPNSPIIEEQINVPINEQVIENIETPSFMDINKIEQDAHDIYPQQKINTDFINIEPEVSVPEFNFVNQEPEQPAPEFNFVNQEPEQPAPEFNFVNQEPEASVPEFNFVNQEPEASAPEFNFVNQEPEASAPEFNFVNQEPEVSAPEFNFVNQEPEASAPEFNFVNQEPEVSVPEFNNNYNQFATQYNEIEPSEELRPGKFFDIFNSPEDKEQPSDSFNFNSAFDLSNEESDSNEETFKFNEFIPQEIVSESNDNTSSTNVMTAISKIRECIRELEKQGYVVDMDEMDFESKYQINIKIDK